MLYPLSYGDTPLLSLIILVRYLFYKKKGARANLTPVNRLHDNRLATEQTQIHQERLPKVEQFIFEKLTHKTFNLILKRTYY